ncbi:hypothetical protein AB0K86_19030 [Streptomyces clavifer]|uniref:hypothetical protein n=1 Tax=Streptomyces TaxID=1883 RepID=UPI0006F81EE9|nr:MULTISPECIES: hypothetical protein [unclassified Streptomyces]KQX83853.1 hypothetical protein ASD26_02720 [Streptomyces sp. Root1319]KQZ04602.1 hypothetical protein ASD51_17490 [Streptomyces sp. Root55]
MKKSTRTATLLACVTGALVLSGCAGAQDHGSARAPATAGPTTTTTVAPADAARVAERYKQHGGAREVYGIQKGTGPGGVPLLTVWTHDANDSAQAFERLRGSVTGFLEREEELSLSRGYLMDVFGPDGSLQHRLDARP